MDWRGAEERLVELAVGADPRHAEDEADDVLCRLLKELGYGGVVKAWRRVRNRSRAISHGRR